MLGDKGEYTLKAQFHDLCAAHASQKSCSLYAQWKGCTFFGRLTRIQDSIVKSAFSMFSVTLSALQY